MSGESDDLFSPSAGLLFPDITDNADDLDFTKDFFSDAISNSNDLNANAYDGMGGDDLIADLERQDDFPRLGPSDLGDGSSFGVDVEHKAGLAGPPPPSHNKPFANGQVLPTYGNFQKPSINLAHMNSGYGATGVSDMYMHRNGISVLASPTSPALKSGGMLSPGATSEKLNCLSLDQIAYGGYRCQPFDVNKSVSRSFSKGGPFSPGLVPHSPAGDKRFCSSPLSSPTVQASAQHSNSNGISPFASGSGGQEISNGEIMHSSSSHADATSPRGLVNVIESKDSVDGMLVSDGSMKISQSKSIFSSGGFRMPTPVDSGGFVSQVDASGDGLRPLPSAMHPSRPPIMQRSFSSHALGQLRTLAPSTQGNDQSALNFSQRMAPLDTPSRLSNGSGSPHLQPQLSDLQNIHMRPLMQSMRRVHSTGDIQTLNGMAGGASSPSSLDRSYEDGGFKIGRYTIEERKIRIHRYQQKRTQRNFNKKIKYACRKTLADSRPRVRGRFAKNDEVGEPLMKAKHEDEDEEEGDMMYEEEEFFVDEDSSGDLSEVLGMNGVKLEHPPAKGVKLEHHHNDRNQLLQT
ncbi:hypothetical protein Mapa_016424 [Marchantia paleacea]|nr:hypothetical protein Mapa_016424 [Marchantia paleacea]